MNDELLALADRLKNAGLNFGDQSDPCSLKVTVPERDTIVSALRLAAQSPEPVTVKPLVWVDHRPDSFPEPAWSAQTPFGFYNIEEVSASDCPAYVVRLHAHHFVADKDSLDDAKAAAQADYEARIRSALVEVPAVKGEPEPVAWRDIIKQPDERPLPTYGQIPWAQLGRDVNDATFGRRADFEFSDKVYPGHQMVLGINFNSLARIVDKYRYYGLPCAAKPYAATPADAWMREAFVRALASLAAAISILERTPKAKKAVASDKIFDTMLDDYRKALEAGRQALTAPGATTKSDGGEPLSRTAGGFPVAAAPSQAEETGVIQSTRQGAGIERGMDQSVTGGESAATKPGRSDPSSTRSGRWVCAARQRGITLDSQDCDWPVCGCDPLANEAAQRIAEKFSNGLRKITDASN